MADKTYKNLFDDGYTTYHDDGTKSVTYKNLFDDGYTTYHESGGKSQTYRNLFDGGFTTYNSGSSGANGYQEAGLSYGSDPSGIPCTNGSYSSGTPYTNKKTIKAGDVVLVYIMIAGAAFLLI